jgi:hypothetical protein
MSSFDRARSSSSARVTIGHHQHPHVIRHASLSPRSRRNIKRDTRQTTSDLAQRWRVGLTRL